MLRNVEAFTEVGGGWEREGGEKVRCEERGWGKEREGGVWPKGAWR